MVIPARDESGNIAPLVSELSHVLDKWGSAYEIVLVDDASRDGTSGEILLQSRSRSRVHGIALAPRPDGEANGQSAALHAGILAARGARIVTLDADLQNDPEDILRLLVLLDEAGVDLVQGDRSASRRDGPGRAFGAFVGRAGRRWVLGDRVRDSGCALRVFRSEVGSVLPLQFRGAHRFIPYCAALHGFRVIETAVAHRPRMRGRSKYGLVRRGLSGVRDLLAMRWMRARLVRPAIRALGEAGDEPGLDD